MNNTIIFLLLLCTIVTCQPGFSGVRTDGDSCLQDRAPVVDGIHTLSIHVKDTITHDSVFKFLVNELQLPVYYHPLKYGLRKYAGVYAGNMVLEPCGPYPGNNYAPWNSRAIFFGMNFETFESITVAASELSSRGIEHQVNQGSSIYVNDNRLCNNNLFAGLYEVTDKSFRDSLSVIMSSRQHNNPGIEYIKEVIIGFSNEDHLLMWKEFLYPLEIDGDNLCSINDSLNIRFTRSDIKEVKGITFKVKSLDKAIEVFGNQNLIDTYREGVVMLDTSQIFGLTIKLTE